MLAADAVIAVSTGMREEVLRVYPTLDPSQVHVIHNGVDTDVWYPAGPADTGLVLAELGIDPNRPVVVFVGRITRQKGVRPPRTNSARRCSWCCTGAPQPRRSPTRSAPR